MIEHTKEPWSQAYRKGDDGMYRQEIFDSAGRVIAFLAWHPVKIDDRTTTTDREANARRIVAAVNACAGIPLERLEQMPPINAAKDWVDTVLQWKDQRDELQKDAERYRWIRNNPTWIGYDADYRPDEVDAAVDVATAKAKP